MSDRDFNNLHRELSELRLRIDDLATVSRKTQLAVSGLADSVGTLVSTQRRRERRVSLNSFIAYTLFTVLLGGGFFLLYDARAGRLLAERDAATSERNRANARVGELSADLNIRKKSTKAAYEFYALLREGKRSEAIARYAQIDHNQLTPTERDLFAAGVKKARSEMVDAGYLTGLDAYRRHDYASATTELKRALAYEGEGARAAQMRYYLGVALYKTSQYDEAARQLELSLAGSVVKAGLVDVRFYLAAALEQRGKLDHAAAQYSKFASAHPSHPLATAARRKAAQLSRTAHTN